MANFDDDFDAAPEASFDDDFDKAPDHVNSDVGNAGWAGLAKDILGAGHDTVLGATQGMLANAADEIGGGIGAVTEKALSYIPGTSANNTKNVDEKLMAEGFDVPVESMADKYQGYQKASEAEFAKAEKESPWLYGAGQLAGNIGTGIAAGAKLGVNAASKAKPILDIMKDQGKLKAGLELLKRGGINYAKASPLMALEGVTGSKGNIIGGTDEEQAKVGKDTLNNLAFGVPTVLGMQALSDVAAPAVKNTFDSIADSKMAKGIKNSPLARKLKMAWESDINPVSESSLRSTDVGRDGVLRQETVRTDSLADMIQNAQVKVAESIPESLEAAQKRGVKFQIDDTFNKAFNDVAADTEIMNNISQQPVGVKILNRISNATSTELDPIKAKALLKEVDTAIEKLESYTVRDQPIDDSLKYLYKFRGEFDNQLKRSIPEYKEAAERYFNFTKNVNETILSGDKSADKTNIWWGNVKNRDGKLADTIRNQARGLGVEGSSTNKLKEANENMIKGMKTVEADEIARTGQSPFDMSPDQVRAEMDNIGDGTALRNAMSSVKDPRRTFKDGLVSGVLEMGTGGVYHGTRLAGKAVRSNIAKNAGQKARYVYNLPAEKLNQAADQLINLPGLSVLGKALKEGLQNGDQAKKNAALFSIMQNPHAALLFNESENEED